MPKADPTELQGRKAQDMGGSHPTSKVVSKQQQMTFNTSINFSPPSAIDLAAPSGDPASLTSALTTMIASLPALPKSSAKNNPALVAQHRRLHALLEAEKVYANDLINASDERSGFFSLPPEVRSLIYSLCLIFPNAVIRLDVHPLRTMSRNPTSKLAVIGSDFRPNTALLRTSARIHDEAIKMLYGANTFSSYSYSDFVWDRFLKSIGKNGRLIRQVESFWSLWAPSCLQFLLSRFGREPRVLSRLTIFYPWVDHNAKERALGPDPQKYAGRLTSHAKEQLKIRLNLIRSSGEQVGDDGRREEAFKVLGSLDLGSLAPLDDLFRGTSEYPTQDFDILQKLTAGIYDRIAITLGLIKEGETLDAAAMSVADVREWKEGKGETERKQRVRRSFGMA